MDGQTDTGLAVAEEGPCSADATLDMAVEPAATGEGLGKLARRGEDGEGLEDGLEKPAGPVELLLFGGLLKQVGRGELRL